MGKRWFVIDVLRFWPVIGFACKVRIIIVCHSMSLNLHNLTVSFWNCLLKRLQKQGPRPIRLLKKQSECMTGSLGTNRIPTAIDQSWIIEIAGDPITDNQVVRKVGSLLITLSVILSCLPLLASAIYRVLEATRRR